MKQACGGGAGNYAISPTPQMSLKLSHLKVSQCIVTKILASLSNKSHIFLWHNARPLYDINIPIGFIWPYLETSHLHLV